MNVAYLAFQVLKLAACPDDVIEQVPDFRLKEILLQPVAVHHFGFEHELVVIVSQLQ